MIEIKGRYNTARVYAKEVEETAFSQIKELCDQEFVRGSKIRIMPDVHTGKGCTIGTTMTVSDKVVPNLVGVDIGCGMHTVEFKTGKLDFDEINRFIREEIPTGFKVYDRVMKKFPVDRLKCVKELDNIERIRRSIGSLGGGNHFIEINRGENGGLYLVVHSGSRNLGKQVAEYYQKKAYETFKGYNMNIQKEMDLLKNRKQDSEVLEKMAELKGRIIKKNLAYCHGSLLDDYLHDMELVQRFAYENRKLISKRIVDRFGLSVVKEFVTIHNYIDLDSMILRKGAVSAKKGELLLIPINMRDGSILAIGKGNYDWNCSAPHGAGRLMSRKAAKNNIDMKEFKESMKGIHSESVCRKTLDEAPQAYKSMESILDSIDETVEIVDVLKPLFNYKDH
ncbi:RNA-splicing ligase RtcB, repairs tRNA damage [Dethiosulfatibacter aminovorans DSM 17477]|uniref:3'-phosphate/5'-hydroxy nucleic acid ligase n=1 Tax=Dethiosulfatibacter aminovorans DSM 17477 TaxID=1121476 RepID=A0A1M6JKR6_9FIRM|nr:RtcB family protein [Dethiosulfatibacter aminovorans]SHJ47273.1 RNA-splicing ligase RtcB, repairs tRNA damage [Dethiosulfatibacter aminovorans DSM 17477]